MNRLLKLRNTKFACHHLHLDKSKTITPELLDKSLTHMKEKWILMREIKEKYTNASLEERMLSTTHHLVSQGCNNMRTFIDVDHIVGLEPLKVANKIKQYWKKLGINLQLGTQLLEGLDTQENIDLFNKSLNYVDFIGCLPSRDKDPEKHLDIVFKKAKQLNMDVEAHLDQCNIPSERETEMFCDWVEKYQHQGKSRSVHSVSLACQPLDYQKKMAKRLRELDVGIIVCPSAAISMTQHSEFSSPIHNSIAPVKILLDEGVNIGLGVDNVEDIFMPFCDGDFLFELRLLAEAERIYKPDVLMGIATNTMGF